MTLGPNESLEEYEERFWINYRRTNHTNDLESLKLVILRGIREDVMDTLNMLFVWYIYQFPYDEINNVFKNHSRDDRKKGRSIQGLVSTSPSTSTVKIEIGSMLEDFKSEMLHTFSLQMDTMKIKRRQEEA